MNREDFIEELINQVKNHTFYHLYRDRRTNEYGLGWEGSVLIYSPNKKKPEPKEHITWVKDVLSKIHKANLNSQKAEIANEILAWGGMRLRVNDNDDNFHRVLKATQHASEEYDAPMNSSYTKIASLFGYNLNHNTIWDSRVSSAICYRLALIAEEINTPPQTLRSIFPDLGYIPGQSKRYKRRELLLKKYWKSVYGKWTGHRTGAKLLSEISTAIAKKNIPVPIEVQPLTDVWNSWLVNMVLFVDDLPYQNSSISTVNKS